VKTRPEQEQAKVNAMKVARVAIRLKHMIDADTEINEVLPMIEDAITELQSKGRAWKMLPGSLEVVEDV
jgi:hypothetical protein